MASFGLTLSCASGAASARLQSAQVAIPAVRHYALSACLAQAFPAIRDEAPAAQGACLEFGSHPAETCQRVQDLAQSWLQRSYPSFHDVILDIMKCIDFSESGKLGALAAASCPDRDDYPSARV